MTGFECDMKNNYKVSVILTTYNSEHCIATTLDSLLNQTMVDFELIILDDGSTDNTVALLQSYCDPRIRLVVNEQNIGVSATRNKGLSLARGKYISPCDHDDISLPDKLQKQVDYLDVNPDAVMVSTQVKIFVRGQEYPHHQYDSPAPHLLHWMLYLRSPIVHSSICFRRSTFVENSLNYNPEIKYADDYELYHRFADLGQIVMLPQELVIKHEDGLNASFSHQEEMDKNLHKLFIAQYQHLFGCEIANDDIERIQRICNAGKVAQSESELIKLGEFLESLSQAFCEKYTLDMSQIKDIKKITSEEWWRAISHYAKSERRPRALSLYKQIPFFRTCRIPIKSRMRESVAASIGPALLERIKRTVA